MANEKPKDQVVRVGTATEKGSAASAGGVKRHG